MIFTQFIDRYKFTDADIAEVGVAEGGTAKHLAEMFPEKTNHLFDTFTGIPDILSEPDFIFSDPHRVGDFACDYEKVKKKFSKYPNVVFHKGIFPETAKSVSNNKFCLVNIDVDIYQSTKDCLEFFYPRLITGGVLIIYDDYTCLQAVKKAVDDFVATIPESLQIYPKLGRFIEKV